jgi:predicted ATPase
MDRKVDAARGLAAAVGLPTVGSDAVRDDATLAAQRSLAEQLGSLVAPTHRGFFLRAEDFFGFTKYVARLRAELQRRLVEIEAEYEGRSAYARGLASDPPRRRWRSSSSGTA